MSCIGQGTCDEAPGATAVRRCSAQQRCTIKHLDRCVGFRRPVQGQDTWVCNAVANRAGIRRE